MPPTRPTGRPPRRAATVVRARRRAVVLAVVLAGLLVGCSSADDGVRVRDRDGAGVPFEDET